MAKCELHQCKNCKETFGKWELSPKNNLCSSCYHKINEVFKEKDRIRNFGKSRDNQVDVNLERLADIVE